MIADKPQLQAGLLTIVAGLADAGGSVAMGGVFAANMTGNTVLAGPLAVIGLLPIGGEPALMPVALAMGLQASAITHFGGTAVSTVMATGTLARVAEAALDWIWPTRRGAAGAMAAGGARPVRVE